MKLNKSEFGEVIMSNKMTIGIGGISWQAKVEVTNRQSRVEFKIIDGFATEQDVRSGVGNIFRDTYSYSSNGLGFSDDKKLTLARINNDIEKLESQLEKLKFAAKVVRKKNWVELK
ncbi:MAG: hypothetical protein ACN2B6_00290 [Rickettsiales bacterium]